MTGGPPIDSDSKTVTPVTIRAITTNSKRGVMQQLLPRFEAASGYRVELDFQPSKVALQSLLAGQEADLAVLGDSAMRSLQAAGRIVGEPTFISRVGVGIGVKSGAPHPPISTFEEFRAALLGSKSITYSRDGASGLHFARVISELGIAEEIQAKATILTRGLVAGLVADGTVELAVQQVSEILAVPGVELVGPLPAKAQQFTVSSASLMADSKAQGPSRELIDFLRSGEAQSVFVACGFEPF